MCRTFISSVVSQEAKGDGCMLLLVVFPGGREKEAAPAHVRTPTLGRHSLPLLLKHVMPPKEAPQTPKENYFRGPSECPPTTLGRDVTSAGVSSSRFRKRAKGCGVGWASVSSRNAFRACCVGESFESRGASLGSLFCLFWGAGWRTL